MKTVDRLRGLFASKVQTKGEAEIEYWAGRFEAEDGQLGNSHYEEFFTTHFEMTADDYIGKRVLDIGCGPRGSLEWASMASKRIGVDPLAQQYLELGADSHAMTYISAGAEDVPLPDKSADVISALNALDHVDDVGRVITELTRLAASNAILILIVEIGHEPTITEPQSLDWEILDRFEGWTTEWTARNGLLGNHEIYRSIGEGLPYTNGPGLLRARLRRN